MKKIYIYEFDELSKAAKDNAIFRSVARTFFQGHITNMKDVKNKIYQNKLMFLKNGELA